MNDTLNLPFYIGHTIECLSDAQCNKYDAEAMMRCERDGNSDTHKRTIFTIYNNMIMFCCIGIVAATVAVAVAVTVTDELPHALVELYVCFFFQLRRYCSHRISIRSCQSQSNGNGIRCDGNDDASTNTTTNTE